MSRRLRPQSLMYAGNVPFQASREIMFSKEKPITSSRPVHVEIDLGEASFC
jgi:hypothetical protein